MSGAGPVGPARSTVRRAVRTSAAGFGAVACLSGLGYLVLCVAVRLDALNAADGRLAELGRPQDEWGPLQQRLVLAPDIFQPVTDFGALIVLMLVVLAVRRQPRPVIEIGLVAVVAAAAAAGSKFLVARPDVQGNFYNHGSYPSGHVLSVVVCTGLALLLLWPEPRWWHLVLPVIPGLALGFCLVVIGMHWASDAVGSILLGIAALAFAAGWTVASAGSAAPEQVPDPVDGSAASGIRSR